MIPVLDNHSIHYFQNYTLSFVQTVSLHVTFARASWSKDACVYIHHTWIVLQAYRKRHWYAIMVYADRSIHYFQSNQYQLIAILWLSVFRYRYFFPIQRKGTRVACVEVDDGERAHRQMYLHIVVHIMPMSCPHTALQPDNENKFMW